MPELVVASLGAVLVDDHGLQAVLHTPMACEDPNNGDLLLSGVVEEVADGLLDFLTFFPSRVDEVERRFIPLKFEIGPKFLAEDLHRSYVTNRGREVPLSLLHVLDLKIYLEAAVVRGGSVRDQDSPCWYEEVILLLLLNRFQSKRHLLFQIYLTILFCDSN